jgi:hypothetical protein
LLLGGPDQLKTPVMVLLTGFTGLAELAGKGKAVGLDPRASASPPPSDVPIKKVPAIASSMEIIGAGKRPPAPRL